VAWARSMFLGHSLLGCRTRVPAGRINEVFRAVHRNDMRYRWIDGIIAPALPDLQ
jgi:hypothetical protein